MIQRHRVQEIVDLKVCDIRRGKAPTVLLHGKGSKIRTVPLMKKTMGHFENYVKIFHPNENEYSEDPLFYSIARKNLSALDESSREKTGLHIWKCCKENLSRNARNNTPAYASA